MSALTIALQYKREYIIHMYKQSKQLYSKTIILIV